MDDGDEWIELDFDKVETHTQMAVLFVIDDEKQWVPRSLMNGEPPVPGAPAGTIEVREWWALEHGLI